MKKTQTMGGKTFIPYLFLLPCLSVFGLFVFFPFTKTVLYSFTLTSSRGIPLEIVGLENYIKLFKSPAFLNSLRLTLIFAPMVSIPTLLGAYILAALANEKVRGSHVYEVMYSLPMAVASAPASVIWFMLLSSGKSGMINHLLGTEIRWLLDAKYALTGVALVTVWLNLGTGFIFLLTGFRNVPNELIESARIDGASYFRRFFRIITPLASPQIFFVIFLNIVVSFQAFAQIRLLTQGGPNYTTNVLVYSIYQAAIRDTRFETAFAQSMVLFIVILSVSIVQFRTEGKMVHYQ
ncbi:MAG: sugar ABC transporter permease [Spirochaetaceae bacterium]|jgi:sn-glycerol 3-phosphate transport system permease protein|nr:sugar ABC transporter permease [Spirochaetaceae bacterium]